MVTMIQMMMMVLKNSVDISTDDSDSIAESDPEDNEPMTKTAQFQRRQQKLQRKCTHGQKKHSWPPDATFSGNQPQAPDEIVSPVQYFRKFISDEMLAAAVENTNLYSVQKDGKSVETDVK